MFALILGELALKILGAKLGGVAEEVAKIPALVRESAVALNNLAIEETGQPIDWDKIEEHHHFSDPTPTPPTEPPSE